MPREPTVLPGGQIISGVGGRIWMTTNYEDEADLPSSYIVFNALNSLDPKKQGDPDGTGAVEEQPYLEITQWSISRTLILAEVPHSGCAGGVTRRVIGQTWRFNASLPLDQSNFPDDLFSIGEIGIPDTDNSDTPVVGDVSIAFWLGAVDINPEAVFMGMKQKLYYSPRAIIHQINPVLNASGDVIRYTITGEESCRLFLLPNEEVICDRYLKYLNRHKGWL